jgi:hypothetical protein
MQYIHQDLGTRKRGEVVEVCLTGWANVQLLTPNDFTNYSKGRSYRYAQGGLFKQSPVRLQIPSHGHWYVTVDTRGLTNGTRASFRMLPSSLPEIKQTPLSAVPSLIRHDVTPSVESNYKIYDVFISHASEDKESIAQKLAQALEDKNLKIWFDEVTLRIGDGLRQKIDKGIASSRFALVILSPAFIEKGWTNYELDGIVSRYIAGEQRLLPIWHNVTKQQVLEYSPSIADKLARSTATHTVEEIADEIADLIQSHK